MMHGSELSNSKLSRNFFVRKRTCAVCNRRFSVNKSVREIAEQMSVENRSVERMRKFYGEYRSVEHWRILCATFGRNYLSFMRYPQNSILPGPKTSTNIQGYWWNS